MIAPFALDATGYHADTKRHYTGRVAELVKLDSPLGESYRRNFLGLPQVATQETKPLLRSLPEAKQCRHLGPVLKQKEGCGTCTTYQCAKRGETKMTYCTGECGQWEKPNSTLANVPLNNRSIRFDQYNLAPGHGGARLNPSIIEYKDGYLFAWRNSWLRSVTCAIRLDKQFNPFGSVYKINAYHHDATTCQEDARLFWHQGNLHMWFTGYRKHKGKRIANTLVAKLDNETLKPVYIFHPRIPNRPLWIKNTAFFDYNDELYSIFSITPHRVHKVYCETVQQTWQTSTRTSWKYGYLRGGASPIRVGDSFIHFFHGMKERDGGRLYTVGAYKFESKPPFRITHITNEPLDIADPKTNPKPGVDVVFPCGLMLVNGFYVVSMGLHDRWSEIRFYSEQQVESALEAI